MQLGAGHAERGSADRGASAACYGCTCSQTDYRCAQPDHGGHWRDSRTGCRQAYDCPG